MNKTGLKSKFPAAAGIVCYRLISILTTGRDPGGGVLSSKETVSQLPIFDSVADFGSLKWYDAVMKSPEILAKKVQQEAIDLGASIYDNSEVLEVKDLADHVLLKLNQQGEIREFTAKAVVLATGAWVGQKIFNNSKISCDWCTAYNIILNKQIDSTHALGFQSDLGRLYFLTPRADCSVLGTFHIPHKGSPDLAAIPDREIEDRILEFVKLCPASGLTIDDVAGVELGVLPSDNSLNKDCVPLGREKIIVSGRVLEVVSTKYTTFEILAQKIQNRLSRILF
ncbi:MAG: FAD-dependent oxidoreductase [Bdellovibrionota bacterium]